MKLLDLPQNHESIIVGFDDHLSDEVKLRLTELGFEKDQSVSCIRRPPLGAPLVFQVGGSIFSLARDISSQIEVSDKK